jgi:hypothetical protein
MPKEFGKAGVGIRIVVHGKERSFELRRNGEGLRAVSTSDERERRNAGKHVAPILREVVPQQIGPDGLDTPLTTSAMTPAISSPVVPPKVRQDQSG